MLDSMMHACQGSINELSEFKSKIIGKESNSISDKLLSDKSLETEQAMQVIDYLNQALFTFSTQKVFFAHEEKRHYPIHLHFNLVKYWVLDLNKNFASEIKFKAFDVITGSSQTSEVKYVNENTRYVVDTPLVRKNGIKWYYLRREDNFKDDITSLNGPYPLRYVCPLDEGSFEREEAFINLILKIKEDPMENGLDYILNTDEDYFGKLDYKKNTFFGDGMGFKGVWMKKKQ